LATDIYIYIYRCLNLKCVSDHFFYAQLRTLGG